MRVGSSARSTARAAVNVALSSLCATRGPPSGTLRRAVTKAVSSSACTSPEKPRSRYAAGRSPGRATPTAPTTQAGPSVRARSISSRHTRSLVA
jgi:hypothetical protein